MKNIIPFNSPSITVLEQQFVAEALKGILCGDGKYTGKASKLFENVTGVADMILTTSCTHALELAALLCDTPPPHAQMSPIQGEVILPSYTFTSTANAFLLRGAKLVFCDIRPDTFNMDETLISDLITEKTKVIVPVHYAGVSCEMDTINELAAKHKLCVVEDAAQAVGSTYKNRPCGALSDFGCYSFHETKNYSMGEGGGIVVRDSELRKRAEIIREKGTNRSSFWRGEVDKYTWQHLGSSFLPSDVLAAVLCAQLTRFDEIMQSRMAVWDAYHSAFKGIEERGWRRPIIPENCRHNAHMYYLVAPNAAERTRFLQTLKTRGVYAISHYEPLHSSPMGLAMGYKPEDLPLTLDYAARLARLPLYAEMGKKDIERVIMAVYEGVA